MAKNLNDSQTRANVYPTSTFFLTVVYIIVLVSIAFLRKKHELASTKSGGLKWQQEHPKDNIVPTVFQTRPFR